MTTSEEKKPDTLLYHKVMLNVTFMFLTGGGGGNFCQRFEC